MRQAGPRRRSLCDRWKGSEATRNCSYYVNSAPEEIRELISSKPTCRSRMFGQHCRIPSTGASPDLREDMVKETLGSSGRDVRTHARVANIVPNPWKEKVSNQQR